MIFKSLIYKFSMVFVLMAPQITAAALLDKQVFTESDAILVVEKGQGVVFDWRSTDAMVPASLTKLATAYAAIDKWSVEHAFYTDFYRYGDQFWVKGYGDPFLVSEEIDLLIDQLKLLELDGIKEIHIDVSHFASESVPGRSAVNDPYNAPLSAVAVNFNTVMISKKNGVITSGEAQTPLTTIAKKVASHPQYGVTSASISKPQRFNLRNRANAQTHFAQLLLKKIGKPQWSIKIGGKVPVKAKHLYRYTNTHTLEQIIRGTLKYSNNFMANQLFLNLADTPSLDPVSFTKASAYLESTLAKKLDWQGHKLIEGSGLSRSNRLSAQQIYDLLLVLEPHKHLFKKTKHPKAKIHAKTGTLDGVRTFAGYIDFDKASFRFVFMFNRKVPWQHREKLLATLVDQLAKQQ